ncbi:MAG TPA: amidohydrolase [Streptosporangiaceae bacterium]|nr:amidohydrolase [Streptosporangiaceae bacterium]
MADQRDTTGRDTTGRDATGRDATGRDTTGRDTTGRDTTGRDTTGRDTTGRDTTGRDRAGRDRAGRDGGGQAELIFTGGRVYTVPPGGRRMIRATASGGTGGNGGPPATAVAVRGGRILAVGTDSEIAALASQQAESVDLRGRPLLPGFQDAHVHPAFAGLTMLRCDLADAADTADALARIKAYADAHPEQEWISGSGWRMEWFAGGTPSAGLLDSVLPDRPAYLTNRDGHGAWVNSRALELAGLTAATPDPADGRIERDAGGEPQGTLHEGAAPLVGRLVPGATFAERGRGLLLAQQHLHSLGITAWQDAIIGDYLGYPDPLPVYLAAAADGSLTARVEGALWWDRGRGGEQLADLLGRREAGQAGRFRATTVKIMQDGVAENFTAGMIDPYLDGCGCQTGSRGLSYVDPAQLREVVTRLDAEGFGVHFHAIGDRAVREALDALAAARASNHRTPNHQAPHHQARGRHHIAHLQVVHGDDIPRFADLDVTANMQALWAAHEPQMDDLTIPFLGAERAARQYPFGGLLRAGARLAAGSDWAVSSANPLCGIHVAVNRTLPPDTAETGAVEAAAAGPGGSERAVAPLLPEQALSLAEALAAYTAGSAYVNNLDETGAIAPGYLADLVVLDRDPFAGPAAEIAAATAALTFVEGQRVYAAPSG